MKSRPAIYGACAALLLSLPGVRAGVVDFPWRFDYQSAAANCQGALPAFVDMLRTRPLGIGNEGDGPAFLTCSFSTASYDPTTYDRVVGVTARFANRGAATVTVHCTGVFGPQAAPLYVTKSVVVAAGVWSDLDWDVEAQMGGREDTANLSCSLPPDAAMPSAFVYFALVET